MSPRPVRSPADEPTVMWRMRRADGRSAHLVIGIEGAGAWALWFVNDRALGIRDFADLGSAIRFSDLMQAQNWSVGWRLFSDQDDLPPGEPGE